jgi:hypothetical protein
MKRYIIALWLLFLPLTAVWPAASDWLVEKSSHFVVYYKHASNDFIEELIERSEDYYNKIAEKLGFRRYDFWLWDNRAKIYIYDDAQSYQAATHQPAWSSGCAMITDKIIHTFPYAKGFFETTLPHELGHIIFREFVGFDNYEIPLWLDEGVSSYQEDFKRQIGNRIVRAAIENNKLISLEKLSDFDPKLTGDRELVDLFYAEAVSVIDYLISEFGVDSFVIFCQALRDKRDLERAIASSYPFESIEKLGLAWERSFE